MPRRAYCLIRDQPVYRRDAFMTGLRAAGLEPRLGAPTAYTRDDVLLIWNRYGEFDQHACRVEAAGGTVLVAENGYVGPGGVSPHDMSPRTIYALALDGHNGSGEWAPDGPERWAALGVALQPWRGSTDGGHILVCPNRSFGRPDLLMPPEWPAHVCKRLAQQTRLPVRLRPHPGNAPHKVPLAQDLAGCAAVVIWSSSAGVHALIAGVPVVCEAPRWICKAAALPLAAALGEIDTYRAGSARLAALQSLAHAQWHVDEIAGGEPIRRLLAHERNNVAA